MNSGYEAPMQLAIYNGIPPGRPVTSASYSSNSYANSRASSAPPRSDSSAPDDFAATFAEHERPIGLALSWSSSLPVVDRILPNTAAAMRPQLRPGLVLCRINGFEIPPGIDRFSIEDQMQHRPLLLGFRTEDKKAIVPWAPPLHLQPYKIKGCYRAVETLIIRKFEDLQSVEIAKVQKGGVLQVWEFGKGENTRRLKIFTGGVDGWISVISPAGRLLLDTEKASPFGDERPPSAAKISSAEQREEAKAERHERLEEMVGSKGSKHKKRMDLVDGESDDGTKAAPKAPDTFASGALRSLKSMGSLMNMGPQLTRSDQVSLEEDDSDDSDEIPDENVRKKSLKRSGTFILESDRDKALDKLDIQRPEEGESCWLRFKRRTIVELRVRIQIQHMENEEFGPHFAEMYEIATDMRFEVFIGACILINAMFLAMETFYDNDKPVYLDIAEHLFTLIFLVEFIIRVMAFSWVWFFSFANLFDLFLVWITGVLVMWVLTPIGIDATVLRRLGALRILRLARIVRSVRIMPFFKELWMLVQGVMECSSLLVWAILVGALVHYMFAVATIELIAKDPKFEDDERTQDLFGTLIRAMMTLFQIMTFDSWAAIVRPIIDKDPKSMIIFFLFMGLASIVLFNLMTAIVVQNAFAAADADKEAVARAKAQTEARTRLELQGMFEDLDEDRSGALSMQEFLECLDDYNFVRKMKLLDIELEELPDIFEILDDGDGQVDQHEFIDGMLKMQGPAMSGEMLKATCQMRSQNVHFNDLEDAFVMNAMDTFRQVEGSADKLHQGMNDMIVLTTEIVKQLDHIGIRQVVAGSAAQLPFIMDPEVDDFAKAEKAKKRLAKKIQKQKEAGNKVEEAPELDPESFVKSIIPPEWIIRNGRSPLQKNPGKLRLLTDHKMKDRLMGTKMKKKLAAQDHGVHTQFGKAWQTLDLPLDNRGILDNQLIREMHNDLPDPPPKVANGLQPWLMGASEKPTEAAGKVDPLAALMNPQGSPPTPGLPGVGVEGMSLTPQTENKGAVEPPPPHPHAVP